MCGILIHIFPQSLDEFLEEMFFLRRRGDKGVGCLAIYKDGSFEVIKNMDEILNAGRFIKYYYDELERIFNDDNTWAVLMHCRKPTIGVDKNGTQPFFSKRFALMHQGNVPAILDYLPKNSNYNYYVDSDSERMLSYFMNFDNSSDFNPVKTLKKFYNDLGGIGIVVLYDKLKKTLYIYRDDSRWLYLEKDYYRISIKMCNLKECANAFFNIGDYGLLFPAIYKIKVNSNKLKKIEGL